MRERIIENRLVREVSKRGGLALKFVSPGRNGAPDRIVLTNDGRVAFVELKAPGKPLRPLQRKWAGTLLSMGQKFYKLDSPEGVDQFITEVFGHEV